MTAKPSIKRALISVSDKEGLADLAKQLHKLGIEVIATGGTARVIAEANIPVTNIESITAFPEIMGGRVKTLHPKIFGGLLGRRGVDDETMESHSIQTIDLLVVNLYPFHQTIANPLCSHSDALEKIDIGGPAMLRAAAKNYADVTVIVNPHDYASVIAEIEENGQTSLVTRKQLAQKVFAHTAAYDAAIANYLAGSELKTLLLKKKATLRYGENPQQHAHLYIDLKQSIANSLAQANQKQGKSLSFNNLLDSHTALNCVRAFDPACPTCVIVKHATPCGVAQGHSLENAYFSALATDPISAFGGIIAFNQSLDAATAQAILSKQFVEVLLAPKFTTEAITILAAKKNIRILETGYPHNTPLQSAQSTFHSVSGGLLIQDADENPDPSSTFKIVTQRAPTPQEEGDCLFAWQVVRYVKSNAIVYAKNAQTLGIGAGQTSRVFSATIAQMKAQEAGLSLTGAVAASDAFFPFADGIEVAAAAGITAVIQPGGSKRDLEVIAVANKLNLAMIFTNIRHFRH